jgi:hypothetical protein
MKDSAFSYNRNAKNSDTKSWINISCCDRKNGKCFVFVYTDKSFVICQFS